MELTTVIFDIFIFFELFMMSKIQKLNGTHNHVQLDYIKVCVVYDVKDTKIEWNSQLIYLDVFAIFCCL